MFLVRPREFFVLLITFAVSMLACYYAGKCTGAIRFRYMNRAGEALALLDLVCFDLASPEIRDEERKELLKNKCFEFLNEVDDDWWIDMIFGPQPVFDDRVNRLREYVSMEGR